MASKKKEIKKKQRPGNPNKANQHVPDPRQALFLSYYFDPKSDTFSNCLRSALKAGYGRKYAENLVTNMPTWLGEKVEEMHDEELLRKAKRNLHEIVDIPHIEDMIGMFGPVIDKTTKKPYTRVNTSILKIKQGTSEFVAERLDKKRYGKESPKGGSLTFNFTNIQGDKDEYK